MAIGLGRGRDPRLRTPTAQDTKSARDRFPLFRRTACVTRVVTVSLAPAIRSRIFHNYVDITTGFLASTSVGR